jgi:hypothetical protein
MSERPSVMMMVKLLERKLDTQSVNAKEDSKDSSKV